jgi:hypothetical protein
MTPVRRLTGVSLAVAVYLGGLHELVPGADARARFSYAFVLTLGYGHLLGGLVGGRRAFAGSLPAPLRSRAGLALLSASIPLLFVLYGAALATWPPLLFLVLGISTWHICENECAIAAAPTGKLPPLRSAWPGQVLPVFVTGVVLLVSAAALPAAERRALGPLATAVPDLAARGLRFSDVFAGTTLFHLLSWLRVATPRRPRLVLGVHLLAAAACGALLAAPGAAPAHVRAVVFSPALYLFWSVLHVGQTSLGRRAPQRG